MGEKLKSAAAKSDTEKAYREIMAECRRLYAAKMQDYGPAWRILRPSSLTDQILIKARRIRTLQIEKDQKVADGIREEFIGIINYAIISMIQLEFGWSDRIDMSVEQALERYDHYTEATYRLMCDKNHDYGEAWREMRVDSLTDIILMKLMRVKQIEDNEGKTCVSEGLEANYMDMMNYAIFALITMMEAERAKAGKTVKQ